MAYNGVVLPLLSLTSAFAIPPGEVVPPFTSEEGIANFVRSLGYRYVATDKDGTFGTITRDGIAAPTYTSSVYVVTEGVKKKTFFGFTITQEIETSKEIGRAEMMAWKADNTPKDGPTFEAHLGRTVTETLYLDVSKGADRGVWRSAIEGFFKKGVAFGNAFGGQFRIAAPFDSAKTPLDGALVLDRADYVSIQRAASGWGWRPLPLTAYSAYGWLVRYEVAGHEVGLALHVEDEKPDERKIDVVRFNKQGDAGNQVWENRRKGDSSLPIVLVDGKWYSPASRITLDLVKGLSLADFRQKAEAFAREELSGSTAL